MSRKPPRRLVLRHWHANQGSFGASNVLDVVLDADGMKLDEVVVTALGIKQEKKAVGYSVQDVGGDALTKAGSA